MRSFPSLRALLARVGKTLSLEVQGCSARLDTFTKRAAMRLFRLLFELNRRRRVRLNLTEISRVRAREIRLGRSKRSRRRIPLPFSLSVSLVRQIRLRVRGFHATNPLSSSEEEREREKGEGETFLSRSTRDIDTACLCPRHGSPLVILPKAFPPIPPRG